MNSLPELALQAKSIDELIDLCGKNGHHFSSEDALITILRSKWAWMKARMEKKNEPSENFFPGKKLPSLGVMMDGTTYSIYGIIHDQKCGEDYINLINQTVSSEGNWLIEQNLKKIVGFSNGTEILDHAAAPDPVYDPKRNYLLGVLLGTLALPFFSGVAVSKRMRRTYISYRKREKEVFQTLAQKSITEPLELFSQSLDLPYYIDLELRERHSPAKYTDLQRRSAYQAEFLRLWHPQQCKQEKNILVGAAHAPEIFYFLRNGVKDQKMTDLAGKHARLLNEDPERYAARVRRAGQLEKGLIWTSTALGILTPYAVAGSFFL